MRNYDLENKIQTENLEAANRPYSDKPEIGWFRGYSSKFDTKDKREWCYYEGYKNDDNPSLCRKGVLGRPSGTQMTGVLIVNKKWYGRLLSDGSRVCKECFKMVPKNDSHQIRYVLWYKNKQVEK